MAWSAGGVAEEIPEGRRGGTKTIAKAGPRIPTIAPGVCRATAAYPDGTGVEDSEITDHGVHMLVALRKCPGEFPHHGVWDEMTCRKPMAHSVTVKVNWTTIGHLIYWRHLETTK